MNQLNSFLENYRKKLDYESTHLGYEVLSCFVLKNSDFSETESYLISRHLDICSDCSVRYGEVFDYEFEFERSLILNKTADNALGSFTYASYDGVFRLVTREKGGKMYVKIDECPAGYIGRPIKISLGGKTWLRLTNLRLSFEYSMGCLFGADFYSLEELEIDIGKTSDMTLQKRATNSNWKIWIAAALVVIFCGSILWLNKYSYRETLVTEVPISKNEKKDSSISANMRKERLEKESYNILDSTLIERKELLASNFTENPLLESFIEQNFRSETVLLDLLPSNSDTLDPPITFIWKLNPKGASVTISVMNNQNKEIWRNSSVESRVSMNLELSPGLYYWRFIVNDMVHSVRKFYVQ